MFEEPTETTEVATETSMDAMSGEIDAAIDALQQPAEEAVELEVTELSDAETKEPAEDDSTEESENHIPTEDGVEKKKPVASEASIDDVLMDRAIKAGLSLADVRSFSKAEGLERVIGLLESRQEKSDEAAASVQDDAEEVDPLAAIPDLDDGFVPELRDAFNGMKKIIREQHEALRGLRQAPDQAAEVASATAWFDAKLEGLGEDVQEAIGKGNRAAIAEDSAQFAKRVAIAGRMEVLAAGYQSMGKPVDRDTIFAEAVKIELADQFAAAKQKRTAEQLKNRGKQHIQRPTKNHTTHAENTLESIAEEIDAKFFS